MPMNSSKSEEHVRVTCDYTYKPENSDETITIKVGQEYSLIKKVNENWWYVQNIESKTPFYIPAQYVQLLSKGQAIDGATKVKSPTTPSAPKDLPPKPKPRQRVTSKDETKPIITKMPSEDDALKVLDDVLDEEYPKQAVAAQNEKPDEKLTEKPAGKKEDTEPMTENPIENFPMESQPKNALDARKSIGGTLPRVVENLPTTECQPKKPLEPKKSIEKPRGSTSPRVVENLPTMESQSKKVLEPKKSLEATQGNPDTPTSALPLSPASTPTFHENEPEEDEINYVNIEDYQQMVKDRIDETTTVHHDNPAESETSDYRSGDSKGGSRESLDSKSCDTDSIGAKEDLDATSHTESSKPKAEPDLPAKPAHKKVASSSACSDYANLEDIQKSIHGQQAKSRDKVDAGKSSAQEVPPGWKAEEDPKGDTAFVNTTSGEKWKAASDREGRNYFYNVATNQTVWNLSEVSKGGRKENEAVENEQSPSTSDAAKFPPLEPPPLKMVQKQGPLGRAKMEEQGKKAKKPSWLQMYAVLHENTLYFFKDQKAAASSKNKMLSSLGKPESFLQLNGAMVSSSPDEKKKEILVLRLSSGLVYLLHNDSEETLQHWKQSLENNIAVSQTLPDQEPKERDTTKELATLPIKPDLLRMTSYIAIIPAERVKIANRLFQWLRRRPSKETLKSKGILRDALFGSTLKSICERENSKIPRFVQECLVAIERRGLDVDGIYRVSGNMAFVQKLRQMVDQNEFYDLTNQTWDVHTITGALKLFFRELSEPLFTFALFDEFLRAFEIKSRTEKIKAYQETTKKLPSVHFDTMKELFKHLTLVINHSTVNRMQPQALAIVFGPTLLWPESKNKDVTLAATMVIQGQVVEFLVNEFDAIFS